MANPVLHWKRLPRQLLTLTGNTGTVSALLDGIWAAINAATYYDGTARTLGVGSALKNIVRDQPGGTTEAIYGEFATATAVGAKWIIAGRSVAPGTLPLLTETVFAAQNLLCAITKGGGAYTSWNDATSPFLDAILIGYTAAGTLTPGTNGRWWVDTYECEEGLLVEVSTWNGGSTYGNLCLFLGGLVDADPDYAESDGRAYIQSVSGGAITTTFGTNAIDVGGFMGAPASPQSSASGQSFVFATQNTASRYRHTCAPGLTAPASGTAVRVGTDGTRIGVPIPMVIGAGGNTASTHLNGECSLGPSAAYVGRLREMVWVRDFCGGTVLKDEAMADYAHVVSASWNIQGQALGLVV